MFYGSVIVRRIGAFVRWMLKGFKGKYSEVLQGPKFEDSSDALAYEMTNNVIGIITICLVGTLIAWIKI